MGLMTLRLSVANISDPGRFETLEFSLDSGMVHSVVPADVLERLGIAAISSEEFRLADGSRITRRKGAAVFRLRELVGGADVVFGEEGDHTLLGALTLASLGFALHPLRRELRPLPMILAAHPR